MWEDIHNIAIIRGKKVWKIWSTGAKLANFPGRYLILRRKSAVSRPRLVSQQCAPCPDNKVVNDFEKKE